MRKLTPLLLLLLACQAHATIALVAHTIKQASSGSATSITTSLIDCTGANFLLMAASFDNNPTGPTASDSTGSNTWNALTRNTGSGGGNSAEFFYAQNATVSNVQTFTFTVTGPTNFLAIAVACFSGVATASSHDQENTGSATSGSNALTGSVTPSVANELIVSMDSFNNATGPTFSSSSGHTFTQTDEAGLVGGVAYGVALIYFIQTTATAENVTWVPAGSSQSVNIETFKPAGTVATLIHHKVSSQ